MKIDFVLTYVDNTDEKWRTQFMKYATSEYSNLIDKTTNNFRDMCLLKYIFRSIDEYLPWLNNVYLIVESESQVPSWIDKDKVNIVYHKDIIPNNLLPLYNSASIELFIKNIPGLSEYFIYSNDDMFFMKKCDESNFFDENGYPSIKVNFVKKNTDKTSYLYRLYNNEQLVCSMLHKLTLPDKQLLHHHFQQAMRKSTWEILWDCNYHDMLNSCTRFRSSKNLQQYVCTFYHIVANRFKKYDLATSFIQLDNNVIEKLNSYSNVNCLCLNDDGLINDDEFEEYKKKIHNWFEVKFPKQCKYERQ